MLRLRYLAGDVSQWGSGFAVRGHPDSDAAVISLDSSATETLLPGQSREAGAVIHPSTELWNQSVVVTGPRRSSSTGCRVPPKDLEADLGLGAFPFYSASERPRIRQLRARKPGRGLGLGGSSVRQTTVPPTRIPVSSRRPCLAKPPTAMN